MISKKLCFMAQVENLNFLIKLFYTQECNMNLQFLYLNGCIGKNLKVNTDQLLNAPFKLPCFPLWNTGRI